MKPVSVSGKKLRLERIHHTGQEHWVLDEQSACFRDPERPRWTDAYELPLPIRLIPLLEAGRRKFLHHPLNRRPVE